MPSVALYVPLIFAVSCATPGQPRANIEVDEACERALLVAESLESRRAASAEDLGVAGWLRWMHSGDIEAAAVLFERASRTEGSSALARLGLLKMALARLDLTEAERQALSLLRADPSDVLATFAIDQLGWVVGLGGGSDEALEAMREALANEALHVEARVAALRILAGMHQERAEDEEYLRLVSIGAPTEWTVIGPFSRFTHLPPEAPEDLLSRGQVRDVHEGAFGEMEPWVEPSPEGSLAVRGGRAYGDVHYAAVDFSVPSDGDYLLFWRTRALVRASISGVEVLQRDDAGERAPTRGLQPIRLSEGEHRLMVRLRDVGHEGLELRLLSSHGNDAGIEFSPATSRPLSSWRMPGEGSPSARASSWRRRARADSPEPVSLVTRQESLLDELTRRLRRDPTGLLAAYLAASHLEAFDIDSAKALIERVRAGAPSFSEGHHLAALVASPDPALPPDIRMGRESEAARLSAKLDPLHARARVTAGSIAIRQGRYEDAWRLLDEAEAIAPLSATLAFRRADLLTARNQPLLAREVLEAAALSNPDYCPLLVRIYRARKNDADIAGADEMAERLSSCDLSLRSVWADHRAIRGDSDAAIEALRKWTTHRPTRAAERSQLVGLLIAEGRLSEALDETRAMRQIWPRSPALLAREAQLLADQGRDDLARQLRRQALRQDPADLRTRRALEFQGGGELLDWAALDLEEAIRAYEAGPDRRPWGTDAVHVVDHLGLEVFADDPSRPSVVERVQMVTKVLTKQGLDSHGEVEIPDRAEIIALYTRKRDGRIFDPEHTPHKDTITLMGLETGDFIVMDYLLPLPRTVGLLGWTSSPFYTRVFGMPIHSATYVARAPADMGMEVEARNSNVGEPEIEDGFIVFRHESSGAAAILPEHDTPGAEEMLPWFRVGSGACPLAYGDVWGDYVARFVVVDHEVREFLETVLASTVKGADLDPRSLTHLLAEAVNAHVRGRASSLHLDEPSSHALVRGRGNRLLATKAVLKAAGIESRLALVRPFDADQSERRFPAQDLYRYAVLVVDPKDGGPPIWLDQNNRTAPLGSLRPIHGGRKALLLSEAGKVSEIVTTPRVSREQESRRSTLHLRLDEDGNLVARGIDAYTGFWAAMVRSGMEQADDDRRRQAVEASLSQTFGPVSLKELTFEGADEDARPGAPMVVSYAFEVQGFARVRGATMEIPGGALFPALLSRRLVRHSERALPMLLQEEAVRILEASFELPEGYALARQPEEIGLESSAGTFHRRVDIGEDGVMVRERLELELTRVWPDQYRGLLEFAAAVDGAQASGLTLERGVVEAP